MANTDAALVVTLLNRRKLAVGLYNDERVRIISVSQDGLRYEIWIPSRQEEVWVLSDKVIVDVKE